MTPQPGDYGLTKVPGRVGWWIGLGEYLLDGEAEFDHAFLVLDGGRILEAQPGGAVIRQVSEWPAAVYCRPPMSSHDVSHVLFYAHTLVGTPYGWWDYLSLALLRLGIRPGFVKRKVNDGSTLICSQLCDRAYDLAGVHLYADGRAQGDVTPGDMFKLATEKGWVL